MIKVLLKIICIKNLFYISLFNRRNKLKIFNRQFNALFIFSHVT